MCLLTYQQSNQDSSFSTSSISFLSFITKPRKLTTLSINQSLSRSIPFHHDYPRPNLKRTRWQNLNGMWSFTVTDLNQTVPDRYDRQILVPYPVESSLSGIEKRIEPTMYMWYQREWHFEDTDFDQNTSIDLCIILHFDRVDYETLVFVNGKQAGPMHRGGYDSFSYDITSLINYQDINRLVVRVWDPSDQFYQPRGKQMLDAQSISPIYYTPCSGIWGTVWLEQVPAVRITRLQYQNKIVDNHVYLFYRFESSLTLNKDNEDPSNTLLNFDMENNRVTRPKIKQHLQVESYRLVTSIREPNGKLLIQIENQNIDDEQNITLSRTDVKLWSPEHPFLYEVIVEIFRTDQLIDRVESYMGFREISLCNQPKYICLNGERYFMFGVLDQGYWPDGLYTPTADIAYRYDIEKMKSLGFNTLRKHMKVEPARWYYWCDVLGILVWQDMPAGDSFKIHEVNLRQQKRSAGKRSNERSHESKVQFEHELKVMIDSLSFHPSIVIWVIFNEGWAQYDTKRLSTWLGNYDSTRLVDAASGWDDRVGLGNVKDIHNYSTEIILPKIDDYQRALVLGECGGFGLKNSGWNYHGFPDPHLLTFAFEQLIRSLSPRLSAMIYTQLSDVEREWNGILTYDRKEKFIPDHFARVLRRNYSQLYKLDFIRYMTKTPRQNFTSIHFSDSFRTDLFQSSKRFSQFYIYIRYSHCVVRIRFDQSFSLKLDNAQDYRIYQYIPLPNHLFSQVKLSLEISAHSIASMNDQDFQSTYTDRTFLFVALAMLSE